MSTDTCGTAVSPACESARRGTRESEVMSRFRYLNHEFTEKGSKLVDICLSGALSSICPSSDMGLDTFI